MSCDYPAEWSAYIHQWRTGRRPISQGVLAALGGVRRTTRNPQAEHACKRAGKEWVEGASQLNVWDQRKARELRLFQVGEAYGIQAGPGISQIQAVEQYLSDA
jgi:hypothetical protein